MSPILFCVFSWLYVIVPDPGSRRAGDDLDSTRLAAYLRERLPARGIRIDDIDWASSLHVEPLPGGRSNRTDLLRIGAVELVLRRPPRGPLPPKAHDIAREYRWLAALHPVFPLAPLPFLLCDDPTVLGSAFYVMERRHGIVVRDDEPAGVAGRPDVRRRVSEAVVDALVDLHAIDLAAHGLDWLGQPRGFVRRQIRGWTERWHRSKTSAVPEMDEVTAWLEAHVPPDPAAPSLVHGDFKLDNVMLDEGDPGRVVAVLDWEMSALGDPLVDLAVLLAYWRATSPPGTDGAHAVPTRHPGWLSSEALVDRYAARSGRDLANLRFYELFAMFRVAVVIQQLYARAVSDESGDPRCATCDRRVSYLAGEAARRLP